MKRTHRCGCICRFVVQVRNLCYMVSRREKLKLLQSKAQEQMFNLHVALVNQELSAGESSVSTPCRNVFQSRDLNPFYPQACSPRASWRVCCSTLLPE